MPTLARDSFALLAVAILLTRYILATACGSHIALPVSRFARRQVAQINALRPAAHRSRFASARPKAHRFVPQRAVAIRVPRLAQRAPSRRALPARRALRA